MPCLPTYLPRYRPYHMSPRVLENILRPDPRRPDHVTPLNNRPRATILRTIFFSEVPRGLSIGAQDIPRGTCLNRKTEAERPKTATTYQMKSLMGPRYTTRRTMNKNSSISESSHGRGCSCTDCAKKSPGGD